jgi:hypothetical protein
MRSSSRFARPERLKYFYVLELLFLSNFMTRPLRNIWRLKARMTEWWTGEMPKVAKQLFSERIFVSKGPSRRIAFDEAPIYRCGSPLIMFCPVHDGASFSKVDYGRRLDRLGVPI